METSSDNTIRNVDALAGLRELESDSCDALLTDPPYSSGGMFRGDRAGKTSKKYQSTGVIDVKPEFYGDNRDQLSFMHWCAMWLSECHRVLKQGSVAMVFTDWRQIAATVNALQMGGFIYRGVFSWIKPAARPQKGRFTSNAEYCVWGSKGPMPSDGCCIKGYFEKSPEPTAKRIHSTQKPVELLEHLLKITPEGCTVLDPFMGSGSTAIAAIRTGRSFIGFEMSEEYCHLANGRVSAELSQETLFNEGGGADRWLRRLCRRFGGR
ncbi:DNA-methyltransferase [Eggerthella lenta]|uniref:Methyltransferase n=1 Tax=Eggerthella lenta (strain ATCC 25559 / DSM 2243 / CCUG 17323 / JCM 9979 / KCTC 3265 / NCTC 11813 / VPI 0255 / 1899 B) TaxID=479437 RepID=C8WLU7_EGGLE|nr:site-specific DNA-methyltransferase [Eggerthella lenta]ACV56560.1 DNA methylase N-4/N-6 domain protein [Eggerthella lenta DSM 2243]RDB85180.1 site-specific DNA-methyltransferase [Eggerthella lenta]RDB87785.1 site-specific DNA-methyltransferase [Eggerthella lenta]